MIKKKIYRRTVEANGWEVGDFAVKESGVYVRIGKFRRSSWDRAFEVTDLTLEEAELIIAL